jgi:activator of HSP90 ATPase
LFLSKIHPHARIDPWSKPAAQEAKMTGSIQLPTRRGAIASIAAAFGALAAGRHTQGQQPEVKPAPSTGANEKRTSLHQEIDLNATPQRIYDILMDAKKFAAVTGLSAEIDPAPGGTFKTFGGVIEGRNVELISGQRIVQAWRPTYWDPGFYSLVHFELKVHEAGTMLVLDHTGFPEGDFDHLDAGWYTRYWTPLKKYIS